MKKQTTYRAALYLRVSKEENTSFRNSIENQKQFLVEYLKNMPDVSIYDCYADNGYSGLIFEERPGFLRMWEDIISHKVNMVVVKDLSRFGREHIKTDTYIQKIFPSLGVRFLAAADSYDSLFAKEGEQNLLLPVKNFINDQYARDISIKIRSSQEAMRRTGICAKAYVSYGYQKKQGRLYPDLESARVVRLIFLLKLEGKSANEIAKQLNIWGISSPAEFRREQGHPYYTGFQEQEIARWSGRSVDRILKDSVYTGVLEQGKRKRISYKVQKVVWTKKEEWSVVKGTHTAIISKATYQLVQQISLLDLRRASGQSEPYLFSGLLFCKDCGRAMIRRNGSLKGSTYLCSSYQKGLGCSRHAVLEIQIFQIVLSILEPYQSQFLAAEKTMQEKAQKRRKNKIWNIFIEKNLEKIERYKRRMEQAKEDFLQGKLQQSDYMQYQDIYLKEQEYLKQANFLCEQEKRKREIENQRSKAIPDRLWVVLLIDKIEIFQKKKIRISFRFRMDI